MAARYEYGGIQTTVSWTRTFKRNTLDEGIKKQHWEIALDNYIKKTSEVKKDLFKSLKLVKNFNDVDLSLSILNG